LVADVKTRDNGAVPIVPRGLVDQVKIKNGVQRAKRALSPDVIRIVYSLAEDWTGQHSLFFRVILSDKASAPHRLPETTQRVSSRILTEIHVHELGLQTYFNFRSESEQAKLREPAWEP
jgi:hypothetical protein